MKEIFGLWSIRAMLALLASIIFFSIMAGQLSDYPSIADNLEIAAFLCFAALLVGIVPTVYFDLAPMDYYFTFVHGGRAKAVVAGGQPVAILLPDGWDLDEEGTVYECDRVWSIFGGLRFYGLYPLRDIHIYPFRWTGVKAGREPQSYAQDLDYVLLTPYPYYFEVDAKDRKAFPFTVKVQVILQVVNPEKALFHVQSWLNMSIAKLTPAIRRAVGEETFKDLVNKAGQPEIQTKVNQEVAADGLAAFLEQNYGVRLISLEVIDFNAPNKELEQVVVKKAAAEAEAEATRIAARAKSSALNEEAKGRARAIRQVNEAVRAGGDIGRLTTIMEGLNTPNKVVFLPDVVGQLLSQLLSRLGQQGPPPGPIPPAANPPANP